MGKQYTCVDCKRPFQSQFALTAHIRFCKKKTTVKCPECGKVCNRKGVASHRSSVHGVAGTSRWAIKARKAPKKPAKKRVKRKVIHGSRVDLLVRKLLREPFFQEVLKEWAMHVESAIVEKVVDATSFANLYLEMMRDPKDDQARQGCAAFATFMKPRKWSKILDVLRGAIDAGTLLTFEKPEAEEFYNQFKGMIIGQIAEYWEQFISARQSKENPPEMVPSPPAPTEPDSREAKKEGAVTYLKDEISYHERKTSELRLALDILQRS